MIRIRAVQAVAAACVRHARHAVPILTRAIEARACAATPVEVIREAVVPAASEAVVRRVEAIREVVAVQAVIVGAAVVRVEATAVAEALAEAAVVRVAEALAAVEAAAVTVPGRAVAVDNTTHCREKEKTS